MTNRFLSTRLASRAMRTAVFAALALGAGACSLDLTDPNAPAEEEVLNSPQLVLTTAVGIQAQYADNLHLFVRAPALVTDEWSTKPLALEADRSLVTGNVDYSYGVVSGPFEAAYRLARTADVLIEAAPRVGLSSGTQAGTVALAHTLKAMAIGHLTTQYRDLPADYDPDGAVMLPREQVRDTVIALLELARATLANVPADSLSQFNTTVLQTNGLNLPNTINAMLARYYLFDGQHQQAIDAANRVPQNSLSQFLYPNPSFNPVWNYGLTLNYVGTRREFFVEARDGDTRPAYWATRTSGLAGIPDSAFAFRRYGNRNDPFPAYLPDEMRLIRAEALVRLGNLPAARDLVNAVRTQCSSSVDEPLACQPALAVTALDTEAELMAEILYQRRYELYAQGVRWEDLRRLAAYTTEKATIEFLPTPRDECIRNPNAGC
ncbi:MAG TPA: RagB/SusD family nutrient uptake outer membrane protein [Longimicrobium sp.]|jgi:hypothetical protein|uniref:RagB/SusD family nutrient uptake outer membrane protein n=1 Tax=Longimicrobium sp. TaxID=2029185 RepID=UPI002ED7F438